MAYPPLTVDLPALFATHARVHLAFSGGKDSIVLAHLCRPWRDRLVLIWGNTGIMYPHQAQFIRDFAATEGYRLIEAQPAIEISKYWAQVGLPADVVSVNHFLGRKLPRLQPWPACCAEMRSRPVAVAAEADGATKLLHGQRLADKHPILNPKAIFAFCAKVEVEGPIWEWSDDDIARYVAEHQITLPPQYAVGANSLECAACPASQGPKAAFAMANYSPALLKAANDAGRWVRSSIRVALDELDREAADPFEDRSARWNAVEPLLAPALALDGPTPTIQKVKARYEAGGFDLFTTHGNTSALLVETCPSPAGKVMHLYLAGGRLGELTNVLRPLAELMARIQGCTAVAIGGRRGWIRAWRHHDYHLASKQDGHPFSWVALKQLGGIPDQSQGSS